MKTLILGSTGMLGYALHRVMSTSGVEVIGSHRGEDASIFSSFKDLKYISKINAENIETVENAIKIIKPDLVINAIVKKLSNKKNECTKDFLKVNSIFPHQVAQLSKKYQYKFIHISTDSVYGDSGSHFNEKNIPNPSDIYSITKYLGEPSGKNIICLRTSMIGQSFTNENNLVDWIIKQKGVINGYEKCFYSGLTVNEIARILVELIIPNINKLNGTYNLAGQKITKFYLLELIAAEYKLINLKIKKNEDFILDRTLDAEKINSIIKYKPKSWIELIHEMRVFYDNQKWKKNESN